MRCCHNVKGFRLPRSNMVRYTGVLCHLTSLPSGNLDDAEQFIDILVKSGATVWQMLPITPPDEHNSPYSSPSAFAAWCELNQSDCQLDTSDEDEYWLDDWALYEAIKKQQGGAPWYEWPTALREREPAALSKVIINTDCQRQFNYRWNQLRQYATSKGISLIGDLPIYIAHDSADVWAHRELFQLDADGMPTVVAGVPPDYFSEEGQKWGTVLYDWDAHRAEGWQWWRQRMARLLRQFDIVRIDHFRGFDSAWAIPADDENARHGQWQEGPKDELLEQLLDIAKSPRCIIAEDLGIIPPAVIELRKRHQLEGMAVLQFGFEGSPENSNRPNNIQADQVVYTGTHDNDTTASWGLSPPKEFSIMEGKSVCQTLINIALNCNSGMAIIPLQDIMELDTSARMNIPGTVFGNWGWRFQWQDLPSFNLTPPSSSS